MTIKQEISGVAQNVYVGFGFPAGFWLNSRKFRFAAKAALRLGRTYSFGRPEAGVLKMTSVTTFTTDKAAWANRRFG